MASAMKRYGACIVNIHGQTSNFEERPGAEYDQINIAYMMKALNFTCINEKNQVDLKAEDWDHRKSNKAWENKIPEKFCCILCSIKLTNYSDMECFLLAVSSHGKEITEPEILFKDGKYIKLSEIIEALSDENCNSLRNKPRIILLQACRSDPSVNKDDKGISIQVCTSVDTSESSEEGNGAADDDMEDSLLMETDLAEEGSGDYGDWDFYDHTLSAPIDIPPQFLIVHATTAGRKAFRKKKGSWLFAELSEAVRHNLKGKEEGQNINFLSVVTEASRKVGQKYKRQVRKLELKSTVCLVHTLTTPLIFKHLVIEQPLSEPNLSTIDMCLSSMQPALL